MLSLFRIWLFKFRAFMLNPDLFRTTFWHFGPDPESFTWYILNNSSQQTSKMWKVGLFYFRVLHVTFRQVIHHSFSLLKRLLQVMEWTRMRRIKNQIIGQLKQAPDLRVGTLLDPAGGRGGEHAAPFPSSAPHLLATFSSSPPLLPPCRAPAPCPIRAWPGLLLPPRKGFVGLDQ